MTDMPPNPPNSAPPPPPPPAQQPPPPPPGGGSSSDRTLMVVLSYLGLLSLIPLIVKKDDREVQWHAKNGLMLFAAWVVIYIVWWVITYFLPDAISCGLSFVGCILWLGYLALMIMGIMKGVNGQRMRYPVISDFADKM